MTRALLVLGLVWAAAEGQRASDDPPRFEDFPAIETWNGSHAVLSLITPAERMFRTQLTNASKELPDFAGRYRFAKWGCGSSCAAGAIIDLQTGKVHSPPLGGKGNDTDRWIFCGGIVEGSYAEYRRTSRLMIVRCQDGVNETGIHYLVWENQRFREILHSTQRNSTALKVEPAAC